jgi:proteasome accessory factor C
VSARADLGTRLRRTLAMVPWLLAEGQTTVSAIAARFGVAEGDVLRDLELVGMCGLPPYGPGDLLEVIVDGDEVVAFDHGLFNRPLRLTPDEGFAVLAAGQALLAVPGADAGGALPAALAKLEAALDASGRLLVDLTAPAHLETVRQAAEEAQALDITYFSAWRVDVTERRIEPLLVHAAEGRWYVEARDHRSGELRRFRVDRILSASPTGEHFEPVALDVPPSTFTGQGDARDVTVALPASARWVTEAYETSEARLRPDGRIEVTLTVGRVTFLERILLRCGPGAEVLDPPDLADLAATAARRVLARYDRRT